jgi:hypothetical protein
MLNDSPCERTTAATDVLLALVAAAGAAYLNATVSAGTGGRIALWSWSFGLIALAAAAGAGFHGLAAPPALLRCLGRAMSLALATAVSLFVVGVVHDWFGAAAAAGVLPVMLAAGAAVFLVSCLFQGLFLVLIVYEALALVFALAGYGWLTVADRLPGAGWMTAGLLVSLAAAAIQAAGRARLTLVWPFDHNGIFHLVQLPGLILICRGLSG